MIHILKFSFCLEKRLRNGNLESGPPHPVHIVQRERVHKTVVPLSSMNILHLISFESQGAQYSSLLFH